MSSDDAARGLDAAAVAATLRRLGRAPEPPWLHQEVARRMADRLAIIRRQPERWIDWWGFLGAGAPAVQAQYPKAERCVVEPTPLLRERSAASTKRAWWSAFTAPRVTVQAEADPLPTGLQLVWANMMLQWAADPPALFARWLSALAVDGFVMFSCLGPGTLREMRALYARLGWPTPTPNYVDMHDLGDMLVHAGFADPVMDQEILTLRWDDAAALLADLRAWGGNTAPQRCRGLRTPRWRARLVHALEALRGPDGKLALGIEIAYGHAFKGAPRVGAGPTETSVSLDDMRAMVRAGRGPHRTVS
ncbi:MAG: biotin synthase [Proteobacteria bacterium]|nr:biotin synthase [Pseudomonadota bacterium]